MNPKDILKKVVARIQAEVGRFLILKEKIMGLPQGPTRDSLLSKQNDLESRAMSLMSEANDMKTKLSSVKGLDFFKLISGDTVNKVTLLASKGTSLINEMTAHTTSVNRAVGTYTPPANPAAAAGSSFVSPVLKQVAVLALVAYGVNYAWREARRRARA